MNISRVERVDFQIAPSIVIEFYRFLDGEKRIGITSAAIVCGLRRNYFAELESKAPNHLKALQLRGFNGSTRSGLVERISIGGRGAAPVETLSLDDFVAFTKFAAFDLEKPPAKAIAEGLMGVAIATIAKQAFGEEALTLKEIREMVCKEYAKTIDWREEDREDARAIYEHQIFLSGSRRYGH